MDSDTSTVGRGTARAPKRATVWGGMGSYGDPDSRAVDERRDEVRATAASDQ
jgi:hypothetical protein